MMKINLKYALLIVGGLVLIGSALFIRRNFLSKSEVPAYPDAKYQEDITGVVIDDIPPEDPGTGIPPELLPVE